MNMLFRMTWLPKYVFNPVLAHALDVLFILHADHEQNCGTTAMRCVGSSQADPFLTTAAAAAGLAGPLHGGANEEVLKMLNEIGDEKNIPAYIARVKAGGVELMGFGHRVYKLRSACEGHQGDCRPGVRRNEPQPGSTSGNSELEKIALGDEYFVKRKLYPNVDFYSGIIYQAMGFAPEMFTVLFAIPRVVGWLAQWQELLLDPEQKIARPRQVYTGIEVRDVPASRRHAEAAHVSD